MTIWHDKDKLDKLEAERNKLRELGKRMTFDCISAIVKGDRVVCSRGKMLGQAGDGSLGLITVLRGACSGSCQNCAYYNIVGD